MSQQHCKPCLHNAISRYSYVVWLFTVSHYWLIDVFQRGIETIKSEMKNPDKKGTINIVQLAP